jgi:serine/threonine-protein kinase
VVPELARAYVYAGRDAEVESLVRGENREVYAQAALARFAMWRGGRRPITAEVPPEIPEPMRSYLVLARHVSQTGTVDEDEVARAAVAVTKVNPRLRAARSQFIAEYCVFTGYHDRAVELIALGVDNGLQDALWMERCPLLEPLRARPEFRALANQVAARARAVRDAVFAA